MKTSLTLFELKNQNLDTNSKTAIINRCTPISEVVGLSLEFKALSDLTGDTKYEEKVNIIYYILCLVSIIQTFQFETKYLSMSLQHSIDFDENHLFYNHINPVNRTWCSSMFITCKRYISLNGNYVIKRTCKCW